MLHVHVHVYMYNSMYDIWCVCVCVCVQQTSTSDGGQFAIREELDNYKWFWSHMNRGDSEAKMKAEGKIGNFAIRVNATGSYVMTFWLESSRLASFPGSSLLPHNNSRRRREEPGNEATLDYM